MNKFKKSENSVSLLLRITILLTIASMFTISCSSDDDSNENPPVVSSPELSFVTQGNPMLGQLPEGITYFNGMIYTAWSVTGMVVEIDPATGEATPYAQIPIAPPTETGMPQTIITGLTVDNNGTIYAGQASPFGPGGNSVAGIYRIPRPTTSGEMAVAELYASSPTGLNFPNGLSIDDNGIVYTADTADGAVYRIENGGAVGTATPWITSDTLAGDAPGTNTCPAPGLGFPSGGNGIVVNGNNVYVGNVDKGQLVRIPIETGGIAGTAEVVVSNCESLEFFDGLIIDRRDGSFIATTNDAIVRIDAEGEVSTIFRGAPLDEPANIVQSAQDDTFFLVNVAFFSAQNTPEESRPGVLRLVLP